MVRPQSRASDGEGSARPGCRRPCTKSAQRREGRTTKTTKMKLAPGTRSAGLTFSIWWWTGATNVAPSRRPKPHLVIPSVGRNRRSSPPLNETRLTNAAARVDSKRDAYGPTSDHSLKFR